MAGLSRNGVRPLLKTVRGKRHATDDDHEPTAKRQANSEAAARKQQEEIDINADPISSDDELRAPPPRSTKPAKPSIPASSSADTELKRPQKPAVKKSTSIRAPARGTYQSSQAHKAGNGRTDDKENTPTSSKSAPSGPIQWGMEHVSQKTSKNAKGYGSKTKNIHAAVPKKFGKRAIMSAAPSYGSPNQSKSKQPPPDSESDSEVSMLDDDELEKLAEEVNGAEMSEDTELRRVGSKPKRTQTDSKNAKAAPLDDDELSDSKNSAKTAQLFNQLSSWKESQDISSSQPDSSAAQEHLDDVSNYIERLPQIEEEGSRCTLCNEAVNTTDYWAFWKGKPKTVKHKSAFCHLHKKLSAQLAYEQAGYPCVDWKTLPRRLRRHKATLTQILHNERPSTHRARYEPLALTGKAAAVPSTRTDLSHAKQQELASYALDERAAYPGYYGPHGRRLITENIMDLLKTDIKACADSVVQASGIAAFVQAVLVPEAAVLLIMQDCGVDALEAERIRSDTYDMGLLLHEEIEDEVLRRPEDETDDETEY
ncbi:uncharacterized protein SETTUDRAFT_106705 [Exserohilum turcica Et28A]|uniref:Restriction of telomere capping protein 4 n=1 Tax=Exserohilum turcicum (strain 28A) TaxID=671987 RepID=R0KIG7_EXST2|nr:uncharacterized protein SETTUDRAFT_106705 [Exserohilum turcica Et28A]EOA89009.1 hypothetical protein SETTUDRAFT_106705 [Exserohilum turcica Et28A]